MSDPESIVRLEEWLKSTLNAASVIVQKTASLTGGAIQENVLLDCLVDGVQTSLVLRRDAEATIAESRSREEEFALVKAAFDQGVTVPRPLGFCKDKSVFGGPFAVFEKVNGIGLGQKVVKDLTLGGDRTKLTRELGRQMGRIHSVDYTALELPFLKAPVPSAAQYEIDTIRQSLDQLSISRPTLEWGLRWLERNLPQTNELVLAHRDFRTGNFMVDETGLTAILDWEFAAVSDPMSDIGWFCAGCWRFSRPDLEAGGIGNRAEFYQGYKEISGRDIQPDAVIFWEIFAHIRWASIALQQGMRHLSGKQRSLELALTGRFADQLELSVMRETSPSKAKHCQEARHA
ncbi:phosphotransferase family protein [Ruegeria arenilitoris]|uniref:phosphotransferase family protein n=1 Tax=Ruegeria arenilitoris TaxID=1173585 RepID=UPI00147B2777|nr:phosphotransferase family protein [Ruegeria arenilitoris]